MNLNTHGTWITLLICLLKSVSSDPISFDAVENSSPSYVSIFSPRMDFEQWKPLTGRGDPLRNDPTYDYEPPVLERVHYWADDTRVERDRYPERKSEVLMLGVSSRKPSVVSRPPAPPRKHHRPPPSKYEDFTYKFNEHYPMTILVPPPPPPPGHKPSLYILTEEKILPPNSPLKVTDSVQDPRDTTTPNVVTSYALQESNLIYQSSTTNQNWLYNYNQTLPNNAISSDYAGWGPTTPFEKDDIVNDTHNLIFSDHKKELNKEPYSFYKPMLSESPPPRETSASIFLPTFVPTAVPPIASTTSSSPITVPYEETTFYTSDETQSYYDDATTEKIATYTFLPTPAPNVNTKPNLVDMLSPMMSMPMIPDTNRPEDNLYAHASETVQVYKEHTTTEDVLKLEVMQTMQPPPFIKSQNATTAPHQPVHVNPHIVNNLIHDKPATFTHDPYLHMRFTTPMSTIASVINEPQDVKTSTEAPSLPMYLIIQGHSKVKTYGSKTKPSPSALNNEIPRLNETNEVKHLHPIKQKHSKPKEKSDGHRASRAKNLKSLVDNGLGSIEIQEADIGIKYDVSDGSDVPIEIYRKGIVDSGENNYSSINKYIKENRTKRQIDVEDLLPFDEDTLEEYVYNFFKRKRNETGITGLIAQAITSDSAATIDDLEDDVDSAENEDR
ncbi:uncharacterized protein [Epargyreus clarus]|uniref:uncharacterized protein n=1 Tax=Epargyreus clarus TaxID=520877 RepID=UPI003C2B9D1F